MIEKNQPFAKLKEVQANIQSQRFCTTFNFAQPHQNPPTTQQADDLHFEVQF